MRSRGGVRHGARSWVCFGREDVREGGVVPVDEAGLGAEVGGETQALEGDTPETRLSPRFRGDDGGLWGDDVEGALPCAQEERDVRFAEAVDRLHRVADEEEGATVVFLPAGGEALEQLPLRVRGVLELVDQDVADPGVEREQEVGRAV